MLSKNSKTGKYFSPMGCIIRDICYGSYALTDDKLPTLFSIKRWLLKIKRKRTRQNDGLIRLADNCLMIAWIWRLPDAYKVEFAISWRQDNRPRCTSFNNTINRQPTTKFSCNQNIAEALTQTKKVALQCLRSGQLNRGAYILKLLVTK